MSSLDEVETRKGNRDNARIEELVEVFKWPDGQWVQLRLLDRGLTPISTHWIPIIGKKTNKPTNIPRLCVNVDPETGKPQDNGCPYCALGDFAKASDHYFMNAIIRELQEDEPQKKVKPTSSEKKTGYKDIDSRAWTPVRVVRMPGGLVDQFKAQKDLNKVKTKKGKKAFAVNHEKYGRDYNVMYDSKVKGPQKYKISKEDRTPLTEEEMEYLVFDLDAAPILKELGLMSVKEAKRDADALPIDPDGADDKKDSKSKAKRLVSDEDEDEDDEGVDLGKKKKKKSRDEDEDDDDEDDRPAKKKKSKSRDDDDEDEDDEEDEKPSKKSKAKGKKSRDDDDEDEDEDDEEDEKPSKKSKSKKSKSRDDDEEDEDDEDEDEDDRPSKKSKSKGKKSRDDDDDDDDDEDED